MSQSRPRGAAHLLLLLLPGFAALPAAAASRAHSYEVAATMVMPHLDEMRRQVTHHTRCVEDDAPDALFPVLDQHALRGCRLGYPKATAQGEGERREYVLVCASARVASGTAGIDANGDTLVGLLTVKMGGKNMTFSQRVEARRGAACAPTAAE